MPRIYAACLASYNAGRLHGRWIDLDGLGADDIREEIAEMLRRSPCPNVRVPCPECDGTPQWVCDDGTEESCHHCNAQGKVLSAEEWAIHDYDDLPSSFGEHPDLDELVEYVEMVEKHGDAWVAYVENMGASNATPDDFEGTYRGEASSELEWVEQYVDDTGLLSDVPETFRSYFDYEAYLRDMKAGGGITFVWLENTCYVFGD